MDSLTRNTMRKWRNGLATVTEPTYQPLSTPEDLELHSPDKHDNNSESDYPRTSSSSSASSDSVLKEGHESTSEWVAGSKSWGNRLCCVLFAFLAAIKPSFLQKADSTTQKKLHPTAWLDGLRGVAALMVVFHHCSVLWYWPLNRGWGSSENDYHFVQLPIIRLFFAGPAMVAIFFVVSGFSLSYKPLSLTRQGRYEEVLDSLSSSVLRRGLRLVLPSATITFFSMLCAYFGFYGHGTGAQFSGTAARAPPQSPVFWNNILCWWYDVLGMSDVFREGGYDSVYEGSLWTIPVELHGSMIIFTILLAISRVRGRWRIGLLGGIALYLCYYAYSHLFLFISGVLLAELHHERQSSSRIQISQIAPHTDDESPTPDSLLKVSGRWTIKLLWVANSFLALFVLSMPCIDLGGDKSPGYMLLAAYRPSHYFAQGYIQDTFWVYLAAVYLVWILDKAAFLQCIFTTRIAQYLGKISFAIYICHGTFLYTIGWNLSDRLLNWTGRETGLQYATGVGLNAVVMFPLLFWTADIVARKVDARSVTFARWLSNKICVTD